MHAERSRAARPAVREMDDDVPVTGMRRLEDVFGDTLACERLNAALSGDWSRGSATGLHA